jgi:type I restriction enzyme, R subunit
MSLKRGNVLTPFAFLQAEWSAVFEAAEKAEAAVHADPRTACFYAHRSLELAVAWLYKHDPFLKPTRTTSAR